MKVGHSACISLLFVLLLPAIVDAARSVFPAPVGYVNDFAGVVDGDSKTKISNLTDSIAKKGIAEVAVVTIPSIQELGFAGIEEAAVRLFEEWGIGKKGKDNGILILAAMRERKLKIEVGYGLEGQIPDGAAGEIIRKGMAPYFKEKRFGEGLYNGVLMVAERLNIDTGERPRQVDSKGLAFENILLIIIVLVWIFFTVARMSMFGRSGRRGYYDGGFWTTGGGGFGGDSFGGFGGGGSGGGGAGGDW